MRKLKVKNRGCTNLSYNPSLFTMLLSKPVCVWWHANACIHTFLPYFVLCFMVSNIQKHGVSLWHVFLLTDTWFVIANMQQALVSLCGLILVTTTLEYCTHISIHDYNYYCMLEMHICYDFYYSICKNIVTNKQEVWIFITWLCPLIFIVQVTMYENFGVWRVFCNYVLHEKWVQPLLCSSSGNFLCWACVFMTLIGCVRWPMLVCDSISKCK
jgi:hypothetical protein